MAIYYGGPGNLTGGTFNSLSAFKPQLYPLQFIQKFYAGSITNYICNTNWEGDILGPGSVVNLRYIPDVVVNASTNNGDVQWQSIQANSAQLVLNYSFNGAYWVTDLDRATIDVDMEGALINEMVNRLRLAIESTILGSIYSGAGTSLSASGGTNYGQQSWASQTITANCVSCVAYAQSLLSTGSGNGIDIAPWDDRFLVVHPAQITGMISQTAFYALNAGTPKGALYEGFLAKISGLNVLQSPLVPGANTTASPYHSLVGHPEATTMATKFTNVQADIVLPDKFGVGTRCQNFFGFTVTKPTLLIDLQVSGS